MRHFSIKHLAAMSLLALSLTACEKEGPVERAGEEVDEAIDTMKHGEESTATKADDAMDDMREGAHDAVEDMK